jgi:hypothetical protein
MYATKTKEDGFISFHSISFPSEWGGQTERNLSYGQYHCFHSISFPSEWGVSTSSNQPTRISCFHSISFPSEWGVNSNYDEFESSSLFPFN